MELFDHIYGDNKLIRIMLSHVAVQCLIFELPLLL